MPTSLTAHYPNCTRQSSRIALITLVILLTGAALSEAATAQSSPDAAAQSDANIDAKPVRVQALSELARRIERSAPARVISLNHAKVSAQISARLTRILVDVGDHVVTGETIAELDCSDYDRAVVESSARLDANEIRRKLADQQLKRARKLAKTKAVSEDILNQRQAEFDVAIADIAAQRAQLDRARTQSSRCRIPAPFNAVVVNRSGQIGEYTVPGSIIAELVDTANIELSAQIADSDVDSLETASRSPGNVWYRYADKDYIVTRRAMLPVINEVTRSREARLRFISDKPNVGASGRLIWSVGNNALPANLLTTQNNTLGVFIVDSDKARFVALPTAFEGRPVLVDLPASTLIVTEGRRALKNDDSVLVLD